MAMQMQLSRIQHVDTDGNPLTINEIDATAKDLVPLDEDEETDLVSDASEDQYLRHMANDKVLSTVKQWIIDNKIPSRKSLKGKGTEISRYHELAKLLFLKEGRVYLKWKTDIDTASERLCVPSDMQKSIVQQFHEQSHKGITQTTNTLKTRLFFPA